ncbi:EF-hand domain-containing D1 [Octopus vulgaris]|uniref:EF-hand domain-containing D1 n=1 Tax=Octopus vulgaris TaxID=6645 RepID=A0AA36BT06_OCTVU|nr:EF-hand domain-containing D1 [Octopus vulgaris]
MLIQFNVVLHSQVLKRSRFFPVSLLLIVLLCDVTEAGKGIPFSFTVPTTYSLRVEETEYGKTKLGNYMKYYDHDVHMMSIWRSNKEWVFESLFDFIHNMFVKVEMKLKTRNSTSWSTPPPGVACQRNGTSIPILPDFFKLKTELIIRQSHETTYFDELYDYKTKRVKFEFHTPSGKTITEVQDFHTGVGYKIDSSGECAMHIMTEAEPDVHISSVNGIKTVKMVNSRYFYVFNSTEFMYEGKVRNKLLSNHICHTNHVCHINHICHPNNLCHICHFNNICHSNHICHPNNICHTSHICHFSNICHSDHINHICHPNNICQTSHICHFSNICHSDHINHICHPNNICHICHFSNICHSDHINHICHPNNICHICHSDHINHICHPNNICHICHFSDICHSDHINHICHLNNICHSNHIDARGINCDVWTATGDVAGEESIWRYYFASEETTEVGETNAKSSWLVMYEMMIPEQSVHITYNVYGYEEKEPDVWEFNIATCFPGTKQKQISFKVPSSLSDLISVNQKQFKHALIVSIQGYSGVSALRVSDIQIDFLEDGIYITAMLLDKAPVKDQTKEPIEETGLDEAYKNIIDRLKYKGWMEKEEGREGENERKDRWSVSDRNLTPASKFYELREPLLPIFQFLL